MLGGSLRCAHLDICATAIVHVSALLHRVGVPAETLAALSAKPTIRQYSSCRAMLRDRQVARQRVGFCGGVLHRWIC